MADKRGRRGLGTAYKETRGGRTVWVAERTVRQPDGTKRRVRVRAATQGEAILRLDDAVKKAREEVRVAGALTLNKFLDEWLKWVKPTIRASTYLDYKDAMRLYVRDELGPKPIRKLTSDDFADILGRLLQRGHFATASKVRRLLSQAFLWGVKRKRISMNLIDGVDSVRRRTADVEAWTPDQLSAFLKTARGSEYYALYYTALSTSMRKGELLALEWRDVQADSINVRRTASKGAPGGVHDSAKTPDGNRRVPVSPDLAAVLEQHRADTRRLKSRLVFPNTAGGLLSGSNVSKKLRALQIEAGVPQIRFHDLRKTSASLLARAGVPPAVIQARLGHSNPSLALKVYTKVFEEDARKAVLDLGALAGGNSGGLPTIRERTRRPVAMVSPKARCRVGRVQRGRLRRRLKRVVRGGS